MRFMLCDWFWISAWSITSECWFSEIGCESWIGKLSCIKFERLNVFLPHIDFFLLHLIELIQPFYLFFWFFLFLFLSSLEAFFLCSFISWNWVITIVIKIVLYWMTFQFKLWLALDKLNIGFGRTCGMLLRILVYLRLCKFLLFVIF